jgi:hypothetical protein
MKSNRFKQILGVVKKAYRLSVFRFLDVRKDDYPPDREGNTPKYFWQT